MSWFSRKPDAIDELCESLTERWWEWGDVPRAVTERWIQVKSVGGMIVKADFDANYDRPQASIGNETGTANVPKDRARQVYDAVLSCLNSRSRNKKANFGDTAKALAESVLRGDHTAAIGLADWVKENLGEFDGRR